MESDLIIVDRKEFLDTQRVVLELRAENARLEKKLERFPQLIDRIETLVELNDLKNKLIEELNNKVYKSRE